MDKESKKEDGSEEEEKEIEWDIEDLKQSYIDAAEQQWDKYAGG